VRCAAAQTADSVLVDFGLPGTWASDCARGAMMQVWRVVGADGFAPVNDGKYVVDDAPIQALSRCK
jgi:hypothetical protein